MTFRELRVRLPVELHRQARVKMAATGMEWGGLVGRLLEQWVRESSPHEALDAKVDS